MKNYRQTGVWLLTGLLLLGGGFVVQAEESAHEATASQLAEEAHAPAHAQEHAEGHHVPALREIAKPLLYRTINFVAFFGILIFLLRKPLQKFLQERRKNVEEAIAASAERKTWAEGMYADYDKRLQNIDKEIADLKASLREEGEAESERIIAHARSLASGIRQDATLVAQAELEDLKKDLRREVVETAAMVAKEAVTQAIKPEDRQRLGQEFIGALRRKTL